MLRLFNLAKWQMLEEGNAIHFAAQKPRVVRLEVNSSGESALYVSRCETLGDPNKVTHRFLVKVTGRETVEFHTSGAFGLHVVGDPCGIYTVDGDRWSFDASAHESFTRVVERRRRSPEIELMQRQMHYNMERRLAQQADEFRRLIAGREAAGGPVASAPADAAAVQPGGGGESAPTDSGGVVPPAGGAGGRGKKATA